MKEGTMRRLFFIGLTLALIASLFAPAALVQAAAPQTYKVLVGWENPKQGVELDAYFPSTVTIHVGDTVHWAQNSIEIHTVTFLDGAAAPALIVPANPNPVSPLMLNPAVAFPTPGNTYNGSGYANSGVMSKGGQPSSYDLTFTAAGTFNYSCLVHGVMMSGTIVVVDPSAPADSPYKAAARGKAEIAGLLKQVPAVFAEAVKNIKPATTNPDGTKTYNVMLGWGKGQIDLMRFFPKKLVVRQGDTVVWSLPGMGMLAPHTVTFLNGAAGADLAVPYPPDAPTMILINPALLGPSQPGQPLTRTGIFSSGLLDPTNPATQPYSLTIGDITGPIAYECELHDASGMTGTLVVVK
jgi:plastocyanin